MFQEHVKHYLDQINELKDSQDELERYDGRWFIRIDDRSIIEESSKEIPDVAINRAHRSGKAYTDKASGVKSKNIVRFTTFRHRTMLYHSRKNLKHNVKVKLDLTKKRYLIFTEATQLVTKNEAIKFVMTYINCRLKVIFKDGNSPFLIDRDNLRDILNKEIIKQHLSEAAVWSLLESLFHKVAPLRACEFNAEWLRCGFFFVEQLVDASKYLCFKSCVFWISILCVALFDFWY